MVAPNTPFAWVPAVISELPRKPHLPEVPTMVPLTLSLVEAHQTRIEAMTQHHREKATDARNHEVILNDLIAATEVYTLNSYNAFKDLRTLYLYIATLHLAPHTAPPPLASLEALFRRHLAAEAQNAETRRAGLDLRAHHTGVISFNRK